MNLEKVFTNNFILRNNALVRVIFCFILLFSLTKNASPASKSPGPVINFEYMKKALTSFRLYPYILTEVPKHPIEIFYGKHRVNFGNRFNWEIVKSAPTEVHWPAKEDKEYIIVALGPDGTGIYNVRCFFEHWFVGNVPESEVELGDVRTEYLGMTGHYYEEGYFRLVFLVFEQKEKNLTFDGDVVSIFDYGIIRESFNLKHFSEHYNLDPPIAVNFCVVYNNNTEKP